ANVADDEPFRRPRRLLPAVEPAEEGRVGRSVLLADRAVGREAPERRLLEVVRGRRRAIDDAVVRAVDRDQPAHEMTLVLALHPRAGECDAEAVPDDVDALRAG